MRFRIRLMITGCCFFVIFNVSYGENPMFFDIIDSTDTQVLVSYWNDNFILAEYLGFIDEGADDFMTANFLVKVKYNRWKYPLAFNLYYNIITDKPENYRTDLLTFVPAIVRRTKIDRLEFGVGIAANGNLGGDNIQNGYHKISGDKKVVLPYLTKENIIFVSSIDYKRNFYDKSTFDLNGFFRSSLRTKVIPSKVSAGLDLSYTNMTLIKRLFYNIQIISGYAVYPGNTLISRVFDNAFFYGYQVSCNYSDKVSGAFWFTFDQYGKNSPHFGVTFTFGSSIGRETSLISVLIP